MVRISHLLLNTPLFGYVIPHMFRIGSLQCKIASTSHLFDYSQASISSLIVPDVNMEIQTMETGGRGTTEFRMFFAEKGRKVSPWHGIPYKCTTSGLYNMVVEIPRHTTAKMEIATTLEGNPIKQDVLKDGSLRYLDCPYYWNYGAIPQTWEAPIEYGLHDPAFNGMSLIGDNDPVDAVDVSQTTVASGSVVQVKVVGALALVDEGEIDWKMFVVRSDDPHFSEINDLSDIDRVYPGTTTGVMEFFRWYKTPKGKPLNKFLPGKNFVGAAEAVKVLEEMHESYLKLIRGELDAGELWVPKA
ncbi:inorganic pyrophosphatase family protein [Babesia bovis T2Bo]|uniref:inorganic diphosphatase n=1 Tax=Babesia bovis TaxID=5865 RepID=A7AQ02_BABBO|nr:inorganic pyrophosphatase family protein [Babesia bovis T2Bo]EDO08636.1 inorganic pyrophosphatase family protein [Babesia bovis T2Bo]|eukprot:XP_001612204.1 inorganic pyrophosphatase family protein [Babesia bovis T2Bo]